MNPRELLSIDTERQEVVPCYFLEHDHRWLSALMGEIARFEGRRMAELRERLDEPLPFAAPRAKLRFACKAILDGYRTVPSPIPPRKARWHVFGAAAAGKPEALATAAAELGCGPDELFEALFADVPRERRLAPPEADLTPALVAQTCNLELVASLMRRAVGVRIRGEGRMRPLVRTAKWRGLLCTVTPPSSRGACSLEISGPFALFRRTTLYGRALAALVPELCACDRVELRADLQLDAGEKRTLVIRSGDPILPPAPRRPFDSAVERNFARDFARAAPEWDVVREPAPIEASGALVFPDFLLRHRHRPERSWWLEIVGFWTPQYLSDKLARLRAAALPNLLLCIDDTLNCGDDDLPADAEVIRFCRRIDPAAVLTRVERAP